MGRFDREYYQRYYENPSTAVLSTSARRNEVAFVLAFCRHIELTIERFADVGAGTGWWAREFARRYPLCSTIETYDASRAACALYGHRHASVQKLGGRSVDLLVCRDVLRYLSDGDAERSIARLARKCRGVLYLQAITRKDEIDEDLSDMEGRFRPVGWYRRRLKAAGFRDCGMGLFVSKKFTAFSYFELEVR